MVAGRALKSVTQGGLGLSCETASDETAKCREMPMAASNGHVGCECGWLVQ